MLLVASPAAAGLLVAPTPSRLADLPPLLPPDINDADALQRFLSTPDVKDADVLALLAPQLGITPTRLPLPTTLPPGQDIATLATTIGARAGLTLTNDDRAAYRALDPRLATPIALMLLAMNEAWTLRDQAFDDWTHNDITAAIAALETGTAPPKALPPEDLELLINAAILLSDTIESILIPQLQAAADLGIWPATPVADPVGVLRIGGTGNDVETLDRILQIDARGDDVYRNNAGGAFLDGDGVGSILVAASIDLSGDDDYLPTDSHGAWGTGVFGVGALYEMDGSDYYVSSYIYQGGAGVNGVGIFRETAGNDHQFGITQGLGYGTDGIGYSRDDVGDDVYEGGLVAGGSGGNSGVGLLWDRGGSDQYHSLLGSATLWGYSVGSSKGWFVEETPSIDNWTSWNGQPHPRACNGCIWQAGVASPPSGRGNDARGGLGYLIAYQQP